ncbi:type I methionyl aminopeptidase [Thiorhodococcus drewsii]|uniref:type I methionyl aminopeptidase n=1 Tax=Thiorhodococcus drewsii TaxID=210408 RepID=UPI00247A4188|nr:type I methionyl aminopeptidase [Thiorhodococcus drewsii]
MCRYVCGHDSKLGGTCTSSTPRAPASFERAGNDGGRREGTRATCAPRTADTKKRKTKVFRLAPTQRTPSLGRTLRLIAAARRVLYHSRLDTGNCPSRRRDSIRSAVDASTDKMSVKIKTPEAIEKMRVACRLAADVLDMIAPHIKPGVTTEELDQICHHYITEVQGAIPAPLNYRGFPKSICTSLNHQVCHGIPSDKRLKKGDVMNVDITVIKDGYHGDTSKMFFVGEPSILARRLVTVTQQAMMLGIGVIRPGATLGDIGHTIQKFVEAQGYSVVREYCGHGIGREFHEDPQVLHYGKPGEGLVLQPGMCFTVEPMVNAGKRFIKILPDGWTVVTKDRSLSAQWEHTVLVTEDGYEILTLRAEERDDAPPAQS